MKKNLLLLLCLSTAAIASAQIQYSSDNMETKSKIENLSGPRLGITIITNGTITETLNDEFNVSSNVISQFGYQFEKQIAGDDKIAGLIEGIVFIGGLEKGLFLPSLSGLFGARTASGYEFAIGPNLSLSGAALVVGFGKTITMGNLNIPINFAYVPSIKGRNEGYYDEGYYHETTGDWIQGDWNEMEPTETGHRFTVTIGFNFRK